MTDSWETPSVSNRSGAKTLPSGVDRRPPTDMCVLADPYLDSHQVEALETAVEETGIDVPLVIVNDESDPDYNPDAEADAVNEGLGLEAFQLFGQVLARERAWALLIAEKKLAEELGLRPDLPRQVPVDEVDCLSEAEFRYVDPLQDGDWYELPGGAVDAVADNADLAIRYGFGLLRGDVLTASEYGVLSFHPADICRYRGLGPPKAFLDGRDEMGVTLQRLTDDIDGGEIVACAHEDVSDCQTLWECYDRLHERQTELLATGIRNLRDPDVEPTTPDELGPYNSITTRRDPAFAGRLLLKHVVGRVGSGLRPGIGE